jgi:hypothetical protein
MRIAGKITNEIYWTDEKRKEHSIRMKEKVRSNPESYSSSNVSGRVKLYEYNGAKLKGTWELIIAKLLDEQQIKWTNKVTPIEYYWNDSWHLYFPDFYLIELDKYIEVKGYKRDRDEVKWSFVKKPLVLIQKNEIKALKSKEKNILEFI